MAILRENVDCILLSRTLGYEVAETAARFVDLAEVAGLRERVRLGIGGMAIRPEVAAEMGFDGAFGAGTTVAEAVAFVEGASFSSLQTQVLVRSKPSIGQGFSYQYSNRRIATLLDRIAREFLQWAAGRTSPGVERAAIRAEILQAEWESRDSSDLRRQYGLLSGGKVAHFYETNHLPDSVRRVTARELSGMEQYRLQADAKGSGPLLRPDGRSKPLVFGQYGTGCLVSDVTQIKLIEAWGADGVVHFDPAWGARTEGLLEGVLSQQGDGSIISLENLAKIKGALAPHTLFQVRAHRGLNTAETVLLDGRVGADLTKINLAYGSLAGGTDPERLAVDGLEAMRLAAQFAMPFDVVTNEELAGVPAHKAFAGMLATAHIGPMVGGSPLLQPLFCNGPETLVRGLMDDNYVDFNAAKVMALRRIVDAPIWPGAPVGFMTHTNDRVQSAMTTALHAMLGAALGVEAVTIASTDEAYAGGAITGASRIDSLQAVREAFRFFGGASISPTPRAEALADELVEQIEQVLEEVATIGFVDALYQGRLGSPAEGAHPGRAGRSSVRRNLECVP